MTRTHVIGGPGSGKTTLAEQLSVYLHIPWYELDTLAGKVVLVLILKRAAWRKQYLFAPRQEIVSAGEQ